MPDSWYRRRIVSEWAKRIKVILAVLGLLVGTSCFWSPDELLLLMVKIEANVVILFLAAWFVEENPNWVVHDD
jgi:hypothetical protein